MHAGELTAGDLVQESDGSWQSVLSSTREDFANGITVYNLQVEGDHTYFVTDGVGAEDAIWVHNDCVNPKDVSSEKISHVWDQAKHKLDAVWATFGSKGKAHQAVVAEMTNLIKVNGLPPLGTSKDFPVQLAGHPVTIRIFNDGGVGRLSTAFLTGSGTP